LPLRGARGGETTNRGDSFRKRPDYCRELGAGKETTAGGAQGKNV